MVWFIVGTITLLTTFICIFPYSEIDWNNISKEKQEILIEEMFGN